MTTQRSIKITDKNFKSEVIEADIPVMVYFWAEWCQGCKRTLLVIDKLSRMRDFVGEIKVGKMNVDENDTYEKYAIRGIPTTLFFMGGEVVRQIIGPRPKREFEGEIRVLLSTQEAQ